MEMVRRKMFKKSLTILFIVLCLFILLSLCLFSPTMAWDLSGSLEEWDTSPLRPYDITVLPDGSAWLTYRDVGAPDWPVGIIFTINPSDGSTTEFQAPSAWGNSGFWTIDRGPDNTLWIADQEYRIVNFDPSTEVFTEYPLPTSQFTLPASPFGVSVAPDGKVWFTCWNDPCLGCYDPGTGTWQRFAPLFADVLPDPPVEIAFADDGTVWFTIRKGPGLSPGLGRLDPTTGVFAAWINPYPEADRPYGIAVVDGMVWFLDHGANLLVRFDPDHPSEPDTYSTPPDLQDPHFLVVDPDGIIWMTAAVSGAIGTFDPATEAFDSLTLSDPTAFPMGISMSSTEIWWAKATFFTGQGGVGRFTPQEPSVPLLTWIDQRLKDVFRGLWDILMLKRWETIRSPLPALAGLVIAGSPWVVPALTGLVIAGVIAGSPWVVPALVGLVMTVLIVFAATRMQRFKRIPPR
uniref:Virginiamycin B lyase n=2 Tax=Candidatus Methanophagaceae archaeon ANME-1 ERB6 TaxID=2759912 RepID=A0A7G9YZD6_9EURY|nr:virginiamycin B lyase [Methanosarcinales archaeon ANME-1 ERB6]